MLLDCSQIVRSWINHFNTYRISTYLCVCMYVCMCVCVCVCQQGHDSAVGTATRYGLDGPGNESSWGRDFLHPSRWALGPKPASYTMDTGSFGGGGKMSAAWRWSPTSFSAEVKETVELLLYTPSGPSWSDEWWNICVCVCVCVRAYRERGYWQR